MGRADNSDELITLVSENLMQKISNYTILEVIDETETSIIARGQKEDSDETVIVKMIKSENTSEVDLSRFRHEHEIIKTIESPGIIHTHEIVQHENRPAIILEDFDGVSLQQRIETIKNDFELFLHIAIKIANTLGEIHQSHIIHKDLNPSNILISNDNKDVKITDFGISSMLLQDANGPAAIVEGTLKYISPEQTGRMNRTVDYRTDYYSLGITFYEMLTGTVPFNYQDPMELIHAHIARVPIAPVNVNSKIPAAISNIVMKLMAKTGEDRYQNSYSLLNDLKNCRNQFIQTGKIKDFKIAQNDVPHVFMPSQIIVGRDNEIAELKTCFDNVCNGGCEIVLVEGPSGIGKSTLINELYKPISVARGFFVSGKYSQYRRNVPYSALVQGFKDFANQILSESPEKINFWKKRLLQATGINSQVLIDTIPEMEQIIGKQPPLPSLESEHEQNRYKYVFKNLFKIMSSKETPLTFFLDDLQWVDLPSLDFIEMMIKDPDIESFLLICAYRDNEVDKGHPFIMLTEKFAEYSRPVVKLSLPAHTVSDVNRLIVAALHCDEKKAFPLAEVVKSKTNGNPFFVNQYLLDLYNKKYFYFNPESGWEWNISDIANLQITDNVVDLMSSKITGLSDETIHILKLCSCIGNRFGLTTLSLIAKQTIDDTLKHLLEAVNEGLIIFNRKRYQFVHDKIHEAAYLLTSDDEKKEIHLLTARTVLNSSSEKNFQKKFLYIVDQYNKGLDLITETDELENLARMNLDAGKKAKNAIAYKAAAGYFNTGLAIIKSLSTDYWKNYYDLSLKLHSEAAQTMKFLFKYEKMEKYSNSVIKNAVSIFDTAHIYETLIVNSISQNTSEKALTIGLSVSKKMGIKFPRKFLKFHIAVSLFITNLKLIGTSPEDFVKLPKSNDSKINVQMRLMSNYADAAYATKADYIPLIGLKSLALTKKYGHTSYSPYTLASYGLLLCLIGKYTKGIEYGQAAMTIVEKFNYPEQKAKIYLMQSALMMHWRQNPRDLDELLNKGYKSGLDSGDHVFAAHCFTIGATHNFHTALELGAYEALLRKHAIIAEELGQTSVLCSLQIHLQACINLQSHSESFDILNGEFYDEKTAKPLLIETNNITNHYFDYLSGSILSYLAGNYRRAEIYINKSIKKIEGALGLYIQTVFYFYDSLIKLALFPDSAFLEKQYIKIQVRLNLVKMKKFANAAPINHLNKYYLIKAEFANIQNQKDKASDYYYKAIETSTESAFTHEAGIAHELAANFYLKIGHKQTAVHHLVEARKCFLKWGATAKVKQLTQKYPDYLAQKEDITKRDITNTKILSNTRSLDFSSIMKSSQIFSSITELKLLLEKVLMISMENAGAQKGALILENDGELFIEAKGSIDGNYTVLNSIPLNSSTTVCIPIIKSVLLRKKSLVLNDASNEGDYIADPYILKNKPKSVLAIPVIHQNRFTGILYLENNLATRSFTPDRVEILQILSTQAAISIKIARQSNELSLANKELLQAKNIAESANKAKTGFLANMAHEFRTPLNGIVGELQLLKDIALESSIDHSMEHLDNISSSSKRLMASINEVIDFSELENGTLVPDISVFNISSRISKIPDMIKNDIKLKNLNFNLIIDSTLPELIEGDEKRIIRIILCLLENSIKFTEEGFVSLSVSYSEDSQLEIVVEDSGKGVAEGKLNQIFKAFGHYENGPSFTKHFEGLGLGLSITAKIIQLMNGTISVTSVEGKGSKFSLSIPAKQIASSTKSNVDFSTFNALIVEDNKINAMVLAAFLKKLAITTEVAANGKEGVEKFLTGKYNIIFMDVQMPVMNGLEATRAIRNTEKAHSSRIPIIAVTANAKKKDCIDAGMDAFIQKPVTIDLLSETIFEIVPS